MKKLITLTAIGALCAGMMMSTQADADQAPKKAPSKAPKKLPKAGKLPRPSSKLPKLPPQKIPRLPPKRSPLFDRDLNDGPQTLRGFVDLHTHPMSHLGFGGKLMHGAPDVGVLMPAGAIYNPAGVGLSGATCNAQDKRASSVDEALGSCYSSHAGHDLIKNKCGNHIRRVVINEFENGKHTNKPHDVDHPPGFPSFTKWPKHDDIIHQQMWVDWIKRAHDGGLRVMVALTVNSMTLAKGLEGNQPYDDKTTGDKQIAEMKRMVNRHAWMEIAYSAADLRRIVGQDKLAIILGSEVDDIGNFAWSKREPSPGQVRAEIRRLHQLGVRYMFPVHVIDNHFGGTAMYEAEFPRASKYHFGAWPQIVCATASDGITSRFENGWDAVITMVLGDAGGSFPIPSCPAGRGFKNARGLTPLGRVALDEMMALGMFIDIDHASQRTADDIIAYTGSKPGRYPIVSGHNGLRSGDRSNKHIHENTRTGAQYQAIAQRQGVVGVGFGDSTAPKFVDNVRRVLAESPTIAVNLGSDINGFVVMPKSDDCGVDGCVKYSKTFPKARMGGVTWDYNRDGVAHIGLFPDFLRHVENVGGDDVVDKLFDGAEAVARTWERAESVGRTVANAAPTRFQTIVATVKVRDDDVRNGARAWIRVQHRHGWTAWVEVSGAAKGKHTSSRVNVPVGRSIRAEDVLAIEVRHESNNCFACARDYWSGTVELEGQHGQPIMSTPAFRIGHMTKRYPRR